MRHRCQSLAAAAALHLLLICDALRPFVHPTRTNWRAVDYTCRRAATEDDLWADTSGDDLELAGLDDPSELLLQYDDLVDTIHDAQCSIPIECSAKNNSKRHQASFTLAHCKSITPALS